MNADQLLHYYECIADSPDAIERLRRFILDLAVRGKLLPQDPDDEPASELLKRIETETSKKVADRGGKKGNDAVTGDDFVFLLPKSWCWAKLGEISLRLHYGFTASANKTKNEVRLLRITDIQHGRVNWDCVPGCEIDTDTFKNFSLSRGDLLIARTGGTIGKTFLVSDVPVKSVFASYLIRVQPARSLFADYIKLFCGSAVYWDQLRAGSRGGGQPNVNGQTLGEMNIPIPPFAEQHRIVAKVDELMALCDRLEAARAEREVTRDRLVMASLARLNAPDPDPEVFADHALFALDNLAALTARADQIKQLRQTILNLAVRGKLVSRGSSGLQQVGTFRSLQNGYAFKSEWFKKEGVRLLRNVNIGHGDLRWDDTVYLPSDRTAEFERFALREGDIVVTLDRPFIATGTKVARVSEDDLPSLLLQRVGRFVETAPGLSDDYLFLWINSPHFNEQIDPGRSNGVPHISSKQVEAAELFVPPLAEQHCIVAKVNELIDLCDRLQASLTIADDARRRLLDALLADALAPVQAREMEAAE